MPIHLLNDETWTSGIVPVSTTLCDIPSPTQLNPTSFKEPRVFIGISTWMMRKGQSGPIHDSLQDDVRFRQCLFGWRLGGICVGTRPRCCDRRIALWTAGR